MPDRTELELALEVAARAARAAGEVVLRYYRKPDQYIVETKPDQSPVTRADVEANDAITEILRSAFPDDAILSEEGQHDDARLGSRRVWIVDPLDGTRDFVAATDQFCVHVALVIDGRPEVGAVYEPVADTLYSARSDGGAWRVGTGTRTRLRVSIRERAHAVGVSRLNLGEQLERGLTSASLELYRMGASTKLMALAGGSLDAVINVSAGEYEWDTCAPQVIIREAGGLVTDLDGNPFGYNLPDPHHPRGSIASNAVCHTAFVELVQPWLS